jgi:multisubunit Na+/H+ antiporter MnhG subunit
MGAVIAPLFGLFFPWLLERPFPLWPWIVSGIFLALAFTFPIALKYPHWAWMKLAHALGWINTRILLTILFYLLVTPVALIRRLLGKAEGFHRWEKQVDSYRETEEFSIQYERPF